jgi:hypothetical protein
MWPPLFLCFHGGRCEGEASVVVFIGAGLAQGLHQVARGLPPNPRCAGGVRDCLMTRAPPPYQQTTRRGLFVGRGSLLAAVGYGVAPQPTMRLANRKKFHATTTTS